MKNSGIQYFALITGASRGIGASFAAELAEMGYHLILTARDEPLLSRIKDEIQKDHPNCRIFIKKADLTKEEDRKSVVHLAYEEDLPVNVLINNAGFGRIGRFDKISREEYTDMMQLNMMAPVEFTYDLLPLIKIQKPAYILNVSSTAAFFPMPGFNIYAATKTFLYNHSLALREEMKSEKINVSCLCPGPTSTGFFDHPDMKGFYEKNKMIASNPQKVAKSGLTGMFKNKPVVIPGVANKFQVYSSAILPSSLKARMAKMVVGS